MEQVEIKVCRKCGIEKPLSDYRKGRSCSQGVLPTCKECDYGHKPHVKFVTEKVCTLCNILYPIEEFRMTNHVHNYRSSRCKKCDNKYHYEKKKLFESSSYRLKNIKHSFKLDKEGYYKMIIDQDNRCAICNIKDEELSKSLFIDHDHKTNKIRGLLCGNCNSMIGFAKDNIDRLKEAIKYLEKYSK